MSWDEDMARAVQDNAVVRRVVSRFRVWVGHPLVERHRWWMAGMAVLILVAVPWGLRAQERSLEATTIQALGEAGIPVSDVIFTGRNATIAAPSTSEKAIVAALADVSGIRRITVANTPVVQPPPRPTPTPVTTSQAPPDPSTTTSTTVPPRSTLVIKVGAGLRVAGTLPDATTIATLTRDAEFLYGGLFVNNLLADGNLPVPAWLESADEVLRLAPWLSQGTIVLDGNAASVTGTVASALTLSEFVRALQDALGADIPLRQDLVIADGPPPSLEIIAATDSVELRGTLPGQKALERVLTAIGAVRKDAELTNESVIGVNTPITYLTMRTPALVRMLGGAESFSFRYSATEIRGSVVGGSFFSDGAPAVTQPMDGLIDGLAAMLIADPRLIAEIEIHSGSDDRVAANLTLSRQRSSQVLLLLVRAGVDPDRLTVQPGDGSGELLRFWLTTAENK